VYAPEGLDKTFNIFQHLCFEQLSFVSLNA